MKKAQKKQKKLPVFIMTDQPETCPKCGSRTEFEEESKKVQIHKCPSCKYEYYLEDVCK